MREFEELRSLARQSGCEEVIQELEGRAQKLCEQEELHMAVLGDVSSGKTTFINMLLGKKIREPSMLHKDTLPLRIVFNQQAPVDGFENVAVYDPKWDSAGVTLYECSPSDVFTDTLQTSADWLDSIDIVVYTVSAAMPLSDTDLKAIALVSPRPVIVVLTKLYLVPEEEREEIVRFVKDYCAKNGLDMMLTLPENDAALMAKQIRDFLADQRVEELRALRVSAMAHRGKDKLISYIQGRLAQLGDEEKAGIQSALERNMQMKRTQLIWDEIRVHTKEQCTSLQRDMESHFSDVRRKYAKLIQDEAEREQYTERWVQQNLPHAIERIMESAFKEYQPNIENALRTDAEWIAHQASAQLNRPISLPPQTLDRLTRVSAVCSAAHPESYYRNTENRGRLLRDAGLGVASAAVFVLSFPHIVLPAVSALVAGGTLLNHEREKREYLKRQWDQALYDCWAVNCQNLVQSLSAQIRERYNYMVHYIDSLSNTQTETLPTEAGKDYQLEKKRLRELLAQCQDKLEK